MVEDALNREIAVAAPAVRRRSHRLDLANPFFVYAGLWTAILLLVWLRFTVQLVPLNATTLLLVSANIVSAAVIYASLVRRRRRRTRTVVLRVDPRTLPVLRR